MMKSNKVWIIESDEGTSHFCNGHNDYLPIGEFTIDKRNTSGYSNRCKECIYARRRELSDKPIDVTGFTKTILENLGYDTNGSLTVHEQFLLKHGLKSKHNKK